MLYPLTLSFRFDGEIKSCTTKQEATEKEGNGIASRGNSMGKGRDDDQAHGLFMGMGLRG